MKLTSIKQQAKRSNRYSIYVDDAYAFSLSETALLESQLVPGQDLTEEQLATYQQLAVDDTLQARALRYVAMRPRSRWEMEYYLQRKEAAPTVIVQIIEHLSALGLIDDEKLAQSIVHDRQLLRPTSRRKLQVDLQKKRIAQDIIQRVIGSEPSSERAAIHDVIVRKLRQTKYQDEQKLMQYLARQGFRYDDIKAALAEAAQEEDE